MYLLNNNFIINIDISPEVFEKLNQSLTQIDSANKGKILISAAIGKFICRYIDDLEQVEDDICVMKDGLLFLINLKLIFSQIEAIYKASYMDSVFDITLKIESVEDLFPVSFTKNFCVYFNGSIEVCIGSDKLVYP